jgi:hypothetical protein
MPLLTMLKGAPISIILLVRSELHSYMMPHAQDTRFCGLICPNLTGCVGMEKGAAHIMPFGSIAFLRSDAGTRNDVRTKLMK